MWTSRPQVTMATRTASCGFAWTSSIAHTCQTTQAKGVTESPISDGCMPRQAAPARPLRAAPERQSNHSRLPNPAYLTVSDKSSKCKDASSKNRYFVFVQSYTIVYHKSTGMPQDRTMRTCLSSFIVIRLTAFVKPFAQRTSATCMFNPWL